MGRLIDSVLAAIGLKPSDRLVFDNSSPTVNKNTITDKDNVQKDLTEKHYDNDTKISTSPNMILNDTNLNKFAFNAISTKEDFPNALKNHPALRNDNNDRLASVSVRKDCPSCRYISFATCQAGALFIGYQFYKKSQSIANPLTRRAGQIWCYTGCLILSFTGIANVNEWSIFNDEKREKGIMSILLDEFKFIEKYTSISAPRIYVEELIANQNHLAVVQDLQQKTEEMKNLEQQTKYTNADQ